MKEIYLSAICASSITLLLLIMTFIACIKHLRNPKENERPSFWNSVGVSLFVGAILFIIGQFIGWILYPLTILFTLASIWIIAKQLRRK